MLACATQAINCNDLRCGDDRIRGASVRRFVFQLRIVCINLYHFVFGVVVGAEGPALKCSTAGKNVMRRSFYENMMENACMLGSGVERYTCLLLVVGVVITKGKIVGF